MPVYQYACTACDERLEVRQSFTDEALTTCPVCTGRLRKVLSAVGVVFKGSGFYRNDSRATSAPSETGANSDAKNGDGSGSGEGGGKAATADATSGVSKSDAASSPAPGKDPRPSKDTTPTRAKSTTEAAAR